MHSQQPHDQSDREAKLTEHNYDGIQEYDNPTPGWWSLLFVLTIVFSVAYFAVTVNHKELGIHEAYKADVADAMMVQFATLGELQPDAPTILRFVEQDDQKNWLEVGKAVFLTHCASCHGREGEGVSAPNLTDEAYLHVRGVVDIAKVVKAGAKDGAMPAWGNRLQSNEIVLVSAYIASLRGTNLPGRGAEGAAIAPFVAH